jgi:UDPglucose--hexose-1-phosphate uridylyltransferase
MKIEFRREHATATFRSPDDGEVITRDLEIRYDPLLGYSSRIAPGIVLQKADPGALETLQALDLSCPFCVERIWRVTPRIPVEISSEPRICVGETVLFPNLVPYSQYAAVAVFSAKRHWIAVSEFTPELIADNLFASLQYVRAVRASNSEAEFAAWNINYLWPSGGSLPHPHAQVFLDPQPTTMLRNMETAATRYFGECGRSYWDALVEEELRCGERLVGEIKRTAWMTAFAPIGFNEVRAVVTDCESILDLQNDDFRALAEGTVRVLRFYHKLGYNSFNLALYSGRLSGSPGFRVNLAMITRTAMVPYYRSDAMYLERLHWEAAVDKSPEQLAAELRSSFV